MKIRQGFVSNSSSSSFVLIGRRIQRLSRDAIAEAVAEGASVYCMGYEGYEATEVFELTPEMINVIEENGWGISGSFYAVLAHGDGDGGMDIPPDIPPGYKVYGGDEDYHCPQDAQELRERYYED